MPRPTRLSPRDHVTDWPESPASDPVAEVARQFAVNLRSAIGATSLRETGTSVGVDHSTILAILQGRSWPDLATIAKLEGGLGIDLWPGRVGKR